jgi:hypothetical protein
LAACSELSIEPASLIGDSLVRLIVQSERPTPSSELRGYVWNELHAKIHQASASGSLPTGGTESLEQKILRVSSVRSPHSLRYPHYLTSTPRSLGAGASQGLTVEDLLTGRYQPDKDVR